MTTITLRLNADFINQTNEAELIRLEPGIAVLKSWTGEGEAKYRLSDGRRLQDDGLTPHPWDFWRLSDADRWILAKAAEEAVSDERA